MRGINQHQSPLAGGQGPADLVAEVHMPRSVNQVQQIVQPLMLVDQGGGLCLFHRHRDFGKVGMLDW